jgi:hypothetical protein
VRERKEVFELALPGFERNLAELVGMTPQPEPTRQHSGEKNDDEYSGEADQTGDPVHGVIDTQDARGWVNPSQLHFASPATPATCFS